MCQFISWKEYEGHNYYITKDKLNTKDGEKLLRSDVKDDIKGHGAIENYYPELKNKGINEECEDFSTPDNFPKDIVKDIKNGNFEGVGVCLDILNDIGRKEYHKIVDPAYEEYHKIVNPAY